MWLAAYVAGLLCRWLAGCCGSMAVGGWLAHIADKVAGYLAGWLCEWLAGYVVV